MSIQGKSCNTRMYWLNSNCVQSLQEERSQPEAHLMNRFCFSDRFQNISNSVHTFRKCCGKSRSSKSGWSQDWVSHLGKNNSCYVLSVICLSVCQFLCKCGPEVYNLPPSLSNLNTMAESFIQTWGLPTQPYNQPPHLPSFHVGTRDWNAGLLVCALTCSSRLYLTKLPWLVVELLGSKFKPSGS